MAAPIRVLILEDRPADAELMVHELQRSGFEPEWQRVETRADYLAQLETRPDVILADHTLPQFGAPQALDLLKERGLDIPFIVVTGSISEEVAVERMKQGAADYILKDRMARLGQAVKRALEEKKLREEKRQAERQVQRNLERIRALHEIDLAITSTLDLSIILNFLLEKVDLFLPYPAAPTVRLFNKESGLLEPGACRNLKEEVWMAEGWRTGRGFAEVVFETKAPLMVGKVQTDPRVQDPEFFRRYGLVSYLGVPLKAKREVLGVLGLYTKEEHEFSKEEVEFLTTLAGQAAVAIHNSQLYEQTRKQAVKLEKINVELERSNRVKSEFLSVVSHELRTPLNVVMGYTGMIQDGFFGEINREQKQAFRKVATRTQDLLDMINGVLEATKIEAGAVVVERHEVNLADLLNDLKASCDLLREKEITLHWDYPQDLPVIQTDLGKLKQILQSLINNALKFTDHGSVTISARYLPEAKVVKLQVEDTGIGIPEEAQPRIFEKFCQVDSSETRLYGGVGLGLYVAKTFTELLGGVIRVESEVGKGSTFTVTIPCDTQ